MNVYIMKHLFIFSTILDIILSVLLCNNFNVFAADSNEAQDSYKNPLVKEILESSGVRDVVENMQSLFDKRGSLKKGVFYREVFSYVENYVENDKAPLVLLWLRSPLSQKIVMLESEYRNSQKGSLSHLPTKLLSISENRLAFLRELDTAGMISEYQAEFIIISYKLRFEAMNSIMPQDKRLSRREIDSFFKDRKLELLNYTRKTTLDWITNMYYSLTDEEIKRYIDFLNSEAGKWFTSIINRALLSSFEQIARNLSDEQLKFIKVWVEAIDKEHLVLEDFDWRLLYYYRSKDSQQITPLLKSWLNQANGKLGYSRDYYMHLFALMLRDNPAKVNELNSFLELFNQNKEIMENIFAQVKDDKSIEPNSAENIDLLWAEFRASGNKEIVKKIINVLSQPEREGNKDFKKTVNLSVFKNSMRDMDIYHILTKQAEEANGVFKDELNSIIEPVIFFVESSSAHLTRGYNYKQLNDLESALKEYGSAVTLCPDYAIAYNNIANVYDDMKNDHIKKRAFLEAALYLDPDYKGANFNLGIEYFNQRDYKQAIRYYSKALSLEPDKPEYNHALARAYQEKGDTQNAVKYFKNYLEYAPNGEFVALVKQYLVSVKADTFEDKLSPFFMLQNRQYVMLEEYMKKILSERKHDKDGKSILNLTYDKLISPVGSDALLKERIGYFEDWVKAMPDSHFANAFLGSSYIAYAWQARGTGYSNTVVEEGRNLFYSRLEKARKYLEKAGGLDESDPIVFAGLITVSRGLSLDRSSMENYFQKAIKADPSEFRSYELKLTYLMPKWHGSAKEMFEFAREAAKNAPLYTLIPQLIVKAHWEMRYYLKDENYFKNKEIWDEIRVIYERLLKDFPESNEIRSWFCRTAYHAGDFTIAKEQFVIIGDSYDKSCWKTREWFEEVRKEVLSS